MNKPVPIHKLSPQIGITSRTLRHWESEGLFNSVRDKDSGWRVYDENAIFHIRIINLLRQLDISIRDIKTVLEKETYSCLSDVVKRKISALRICNKENSSKESRLLQFLSILESESKNTIIDSRFLMFITEMEEDTMKNTLSTNHSLQYITLPPMRVVYNVVVSVAPEDEAMNPVLEWLEEAEITGTARLFGGNMPPMPSESGKPYGYGMCASIPEGIPVPKHLKEMNLPGGIYARLESTDNISVSWKKLMKLLSEDEKYISNRSRLCLEEHMRNDRNGFLITLLEPIKIK